MLPILHTYTHILHIKGLCHYLKNVILVYYSEIFNYIFLFIWLGGLHKIVGRGEEGLEDCNLVGN